MTTITNVELPSLYVDNDFLNFLKDGKFDNGFFSIGGYNFKGLNDVIESLRGIKNTSDKRIKNKAEKGHIYFLFQIIAYFFYSKKIALDIKKLLTKLICELFYKYAVICKNTIVIDYFNENDGYSKFIPKDICKIIDEFGNYYELVDNKIILSSCERKGSIDYYDSDSDDSTTPIRRRDPVIERVSFK